MSAQPPPPFGQPPDPPTFGQPPDEGSGQPPGFGGLGDAQPLPGWGQPPPQPAPPVGARRRRTALVVAAAVLVLCVAAGIGFVVLSRGAETETASGEGSAPRAGDTVGIGGDAAGTGADDRDDATGGARPEDRDANGEDDEDATAPPVGGQRAPTAIEAGRTVTDTLDEAGQVRLFTFTGQAGQPVTIIMRADEGSQIDPLVRLIDPGGSQIAEEDDIDFPDDTDAQIDEVLREDGVYTIEATSFDGAGAFSVSLDTRSSMIRTDTLSAARPEISYPYEGVAGTTLMLDLVGTSEGVDVTLTLLGPDGEVVAENDDTGTSLDAQLTQVVSESGTYTIIVGAFADEYGDFVLTIAEGTIAEGQASTDTPGD